jgi:hypothetical protein
LDDETRMAISQTDCHPRWFVEHWARGAAALAAPLSPAELGEKKVRRHAKKATRTCNAVREAVQ